jgi:hypothetical protein
MLKITALQALAQIDPPRAAIFLEQASKDPDEEVAIVATNLLEAVAERR